MPPTEYSETRFSSGIVDDDGDLILTDPEPYLYRRLADNEEYVFGAGDTVERLAYSRYGRAELAWVILNFQRDANGQPAPIFDPTVKIEPGTVLVLPSQRTVFEEILNESRRKEYQA